MANEAVVIELLGNAGDPVEYLNAGSVDITKGTLMGYGSPGYCIPITTGSAYFAGITSTDFTSGAEAGRRVALWTHGVFDLDCGSANTMTLGVPVSTSVQGGNLVGLATNTSILDITKIVGIAQETVTAGNTGAVLVSI